VFVEAGDATTPHDGPFAVVVRTRDDFLRWLKEPAPGVEWLQVEGLLDDPEVWTAATTGPRFVPLDVVLRDPATEFSSLYRLVATGAVRDLRVTINVVPGAMKALRLAASLGLAVRLLPGQPFAESLAELTEMADFYLHDSAVEAPIEFFHSVLATMRGAASTTLWEIVERDPAIFAHACGELSQLPRDFVATQLRDLIAFGGECASCAWQSVCAGFFKWPDPSYRCAGVQRLFAHLEAAAEEIGRDLAACEAPAS
jgi:hypothetical protein